MKNEYRLMRDEAPYTAIWVSFDPKTSTIELANWYEGFEISLDDFLDRLGIDDAAIRQARRKREQERTDPEAGTWG